MWQSFHNLCIIYDPCVVMLPLLFQLTFPPVFMFPVLGKLLLPQRCSRKHLSLEAVEKQMNVKDYPAEPGDFLCLRLFIFLFFYTFLLLCYFFLENENCSSGGIINTFFEFYLFSTLSLRYNHQHLLQGINTQTDVELVKIWANSLLIHKLRKLQW